MSDREVEFQLFEVLKADELCQLEAFQSYSRETFTLYLQSVRKLAREVLYPAYKPMDETPARLEAGDVLVHPKMKEIYPRLVEIGILNATRPPEVGGQNLPFTLFAAGNSYLMAANLSAFGYFGLTAGAARLIESFGSDELKEQFMKPMYDGRWTGTMALTEPQAGSSLADVQTRARPTDGGHYLIEGSKVFISGGDQDITENIVHLTLARIEGAPAGIKGVSLFAIPKKRQQNGSLVDNDCVTTGLFHKIGWRGLPSISLGFGTRGDCHGYLVGEPHKGIRHMFQMMNEARLMIGLNGVASAAVAYHEALDYASNRPQGRNWQDRDPSKPQVNIIEHADVRRMLLRQKAIVEGGFSLITLASHYQDLAESSASAEERERCHLLLEILTPIAKSFPAEKGFEANTLAIQVHGGYGYTSEYMPEAWWRDQKLNSIHEGTTGIHSIDLLGRKVMLQGGRAMQLLHEAISADIVSARRAGLDENWCDKLEAAISTVGAVTMKLGGLGAQGDVDAMLLHSVDYLELLSTVVVAWLWLKQATAATEGLSERPDSADFYQGKLCTAQYWICSELSRVDQLAALCESGEDSYGRMQASWF